MSEEQQASTVPDGELRRTETAPPPYVRRDATKHIDVRLTPDEVRERATIVMTKLDEESQVIAEKKAVVDTFKERLGKIKTERRSAQRAYQTGIEQQLVTVEEIFDTEERVKWLEYRGEVYCRQAFEAFDVKIFCPLPLEGAMGVNPAEASEKASDEKESEAAGETPPQDAADEGAQKADGEKGKPKRSKRGQTVLGSDGRPKPTRGKKRAAQASAGDAGDSAVSEGECERQDTGSSASDIHSVMRSESSRGGKVDHTL